MFLTHKKYTYSSYIENPQIWSACPVYYIWTATASMPNWQQIITNSYNKMLTTAAAATTTTAKCMKFWHFFSPYSVHIGQAFTYRTRSWNESICMKFVFVVSNDLGFHFHQHFLCFRERHGNTSAKETGDPWLPGKRFDKGRRIRTSHTHPYINFIQFDWIEIEWVCWIDIGWQLLSLHISMIWKRRCSKSDI